MINSLNFKTVTLGAVKNSASAETGPWGVIDEPVVDLGSIVFAGHLRLNPALHTVPTDANEDVSCENRAVAMYRTRARAQTHTHTRKE